MTAIAAPTIHRKIQMFRLIACSDLAQHGTYERRTQEGTTSVELSSTTNRFGVMPYTLEWRGVVPIVSA